MSMSWEDIYSILEGAINVLKGGKDALDSTKGDKRVVPLSSSAISTASYDPETQELDIVFTNGPQEYTFYGVPEDVFEGLISAPSAGRYYNSIIKGSYS